jgi:phosphoribosylanthranilate isomerase
MNRVRVKICGITRPRDGVDAASAGADAIGLVFYKKSPRSVNPELANRIIGELPPFITKVGLFVDATPEEINAVLSNVNLDMLQFHGDETPAQCESYAKPWLKAIRMAPGIDLQAEIKRYVRSSGILLDSSIPGQSGGTGQVFDWDMVSPGAPKPLILAGGLQQANVQEAIKRVKPYAVDVSSGVESAPGIKDAVKMASFIKQVRMAGGE